MARPVDYIRLYRTLPHDCGYLPARRTINAVVDPALPVDPLLYSRLAGLGFRRSGDRIYRPACPACDACIPLRVPVAEFAPDRSQRRTLRRNRDLVMVECAPVYDPEHFELYRCYLSARHGEGGMDASSEADYPGFLVCDGIDTRFLEFRLDGRCVAVAVVDVLIDGLSAVYTFFDPDLPRRSLGVYALLRELEVAGRAGRKWLYLGYWIADCPKMNYKSAWYPHEVFVGGHWQRRERGGR